MTGPLHGIRIVEFAGIGPGPFAGMMLADHGAEVVRIERPGARPEPGDPLTRSRRTIAIDMKQAEGVALARKLAAGADGIIEGFRPGVMERLGLGPDVLLGDNPTLVYGRMTGWGQTGPLAHAAGHDINYIALSGVLSTVGRTGERPVPPVNYIGDFGGGGMMLAFAMVSALLGVKLGRPGPVIDAAMTDGSALLAAMTFGFKATGRWRDDTGTNLLDGAAHFYDTYECADGKFIAIGSIEPQFYALLLEATGLTDDPAFAKHLDPRQWPALKARLTEVFHARTRDEWVSIMEGTDICFAPVLSLTEAPVHEHNVARATFDTIDGAIQPMPAPRYSEAVLERPQPPIDVTEDLLAGLGLDPVALRSKGVIG